jgi:hypothetical protein
MALCFAVYAKFRAYIRAASFYSSAPPLHRHTDTQTFEIPVTEIPDKKNFKGIMADKGSI